MLINIKGIDRLRAHAVMTAATGVCRDPFERRLLQQRSCVKQHKKRITGSLFRAYEFYSSSG